MPSNPNLLSCSLLRGLQILFAIVVLGLSATLVTSHNRTADILSKSDDGIKFSRAPASLYLAAAIGALSLVAAVFNLCISWTEFLRKYVEMFVDVVVIVANLIGGMVSVTA
jgi:hypothetical protein